MRSGEIVEEAIFLKQRVESSNKEEGLVDPN